MLTVIWVAKTTESYYSALKNENLSVYFFWNK
jgi:hypothetical protein